MAWYATNGKRGLLTVWGDCADVKNGQKSAVMRLSKVGGLALLLLVLLGAMMLRNGSVKVQWRLRFAKGGTLRSLFDPSSQAPSKSAKASSLRDTAAGMAAKMASLRDMVAHADESEQPNDDVQAQANTGMAITVGRTSFPRN